jgi:hypothetical protein
MRTVKRRLRDQMAGEDFEATYWAFSMTYMDTSYPVANTYYMITLESGTNDKLYVGFFSSQATAHASLRRNEINWASLWMPWTVFERIAKRALKARPFEYVRIPGNRGIFTNLDNGMIRYETACALKYEIERGELEALLS